MLLNKKEKEALLPDNLSSLTLPLWFSAFGTSLQSDVWHGTTLPWILIWLHTDFCANWRATTSLNLSVKVIYSMWYMTVKLYFTGSFKPQEGVYRYFTYTNQERILVLQKDLAFKGRMIFCTNIIGYCLFTFSSWQQLFQFSHRLRSNKIKVGRWRNERNT